MSAKRIASNSDEQRRAEGAALQRLATKLGIPRLEPKCVSLGDKSASLDGYWEGDGDVVLVEVNAHVGPMKAGTKNKVMKDAFKLVAVGRHLMAQGVAKRPRLVLTFVDELARNSFGEKSWATVALKTMGITREVCPVSPAEREALLAAQRRQDIRFQC